MGGYVFCFVLCGCGGVGDVGGGGELVWVWGCLLSVGVSCLWVSLVCGCGCAFVHQCM